MLFYAVMSLASGRLGQRGLGVPTRHAARRRMVKTHLPHLFEDYADICTLSELARYGQGCAMGGTERREARGIDDRIPSAIPWPQAAWASDAALRQSLEFKIRRRAADAAARSPLSGASRS